MITRPPLPIDAILPDLVARLAQAGRAVLQAPPGAGKTTAVPLALLEAGSPGRIVMLEPRRLAARAAAERMAALLGETPGGRVGYRMRGETRVSAATRIDVVTEGILTRMLQSDPELTGIGTLIFDEFHERSLAADLGLALAWEARGALRPDLRILVMSATLDADPVARLMDGAPVLTAEGRAFPVETRWLDRPLPPGQRLAPAMAALIARAAEEAEGDILAFLPGEGEIRRTAALLALPGVEVHALYGALPFAKQRAALAPGTGRKVVLATAIAETSLTIEGVRIVVDGGRARRARFDPGSGMSRLVTERVTRAEAEQRRGRAGRVAPGLCYRLWTRGEEGALAAHPPAEIEAADLTGLALELALWGAGEDDLAFLTPPPAPALAEARALLRDLGGLDGTPGAGRITAHGRALAALPLAPRLGHMLLTAGKPAAPLAALMAERDPLTGAPADLTLRLDALAPRARAHRPWAERPETVERLRAETRRLTAMAPQGPDDLTPGEMAALAYPDRIGLRRKGEEPRWLLSGGRGAALAADDPLAQTRFIVVTDLDGGGREARIRLALPFDEAGLRRIHGDRIRWQELCEWSRREGRVLARRREMFGALVLGEQPWRDAPPEALARAALDGIADLGLRLSPAAERLRARVELLRAEGVDLPDMTEAGLMAAREDWLPAHLGGARTAEDLRALDLAEPLRLWLGHDRLRLVDRLAPASFATPLGNRIPIDYAGGEAAIALRLQELFGVTEHPVTGPRRRPLKITLLSPAHRPVQVTTDLPRFWATSYADVRKDMRGRYPRHPWPEDPTVAEPTLRARPRG